MRLEKLVEQEKRLNANLSAEVDSCRREIGRMKDSSLLTSKDQLKQVIIYNFDVNFWYLTISIGFS